MRKYHNFMHKKFAYLDRCYKLVHFYIKVLECFAVLTAYQNNVQNTKNPNVSCRFIQDQSQNDIWIHSICVPKEIRKSKNFSLQILCLLSLCIFFCFSSIMRKKLLYRCYKYICCYEHELLAYKTFSLT